MTLQEVIAKMRSVATLNVYLILRREDAILLSMRTNTGYYDEYYGLVSGHVEEAESATSAMIREAEEEIGILIHPIDLNVCHTMHRKTDRNNVDLFFACSSWAGDIINKEPKKCAALEFHTLHALPQQTIPYIEQALRASFRDCRYSEEGWV
jgi:8-oxo-dGTP diphosphatase